jgi:hypothetical protein
MKQKNKGQIFRKRKGALLALSALLACFLVSEAAAFSLDNQGYLFLHPFFKARAWRASLDRLDFSMPDDSLAQYRPLAFDVTQGSDSAMSVFTVSGGSLYCMPVWYQPRSAPCFDNALTFGPPQKVALAALVLPTGRAFHVVKDTLYSFDSVRVIVPSAVTPLKLYIAGINSSVSSVTRLDSITFTQSRTGQRILGVFGDQDTLSQQDKGIWVTGSRGLVRYVPYVNHTWGAPVQRDLSDTSTVLHTNGTYAGTMEGKLYKLNTAGTAFTLETASAGKPVWRVYQQGAIGDNGLFKENTNGVWKRDTMFSASAYRYANFIRRPGGFGVELLDTNWAYKAYTYRDTSTIILSTIPASLMTSINSTAYGYPRNGTMNITVNLNDLDSNYSDYHLWLNGTVDLKNDSPYTIGLTAIADTETCHLGVLKMTSGSVRLTLTADSVKVMHDCVIGAFNPTCNECYWKKYTFAHSTKWLQENVVTLSTATQTLRISNGNGVVTDLSRREFPPGESMFHARLTTRTFEFDFPIKTGTHVTGIAVHDLMGRQLVFQPVENGRHMLTMPAPFSTPEVVIVSCRLSDGSLLSRKVPIVK